jgi:CheY-like chemotaxis protein
VAGGDPAMAADPGPGRGQPTGVPRVLLVDDSAAMRTVVRGLLEDAGMLVVGEAADGLDGIAQTQALGPDVVVMDWRMPQLDGLQATARLHRLLPQVRVVLFSVVEGKQAETLALQAGAVAFVDKGAAPEQLCAAVWTAWRQPPIDPDPSPR